MAERDLAAALGYTTNGGIVDALFGDVTGPARVNQNIARQVQRSRQAFARPQAAQGARGAIDYAAGITAGLPIIGDLFGLGRDIAQFRAEPESRTPLNFGLAALGLIPFVPPAVSYGLGRFAQSRGVEIAPAPSGPAASQAGAIVYQGSPHRYDPEKLVRLPDGRQEYVGGRFNALSEVPLGATVIEDFPLGRIRSEAIGTGEGAQAYGMGSYLAEAQGVAQGYRDALSKNVTVNSEKLQSIPSDGPLAEAHNMVVRNIQGGMAPDAAIDAARKYWTNAANEMLEFTKSNPELADRIIKEASNRMQVAEAVATLKPESFYRDPGSLYTVDLPDTMIARMLDWDKPLSEQAPEVQEALAKIGYKYDAKAASEHDDALLSALLGDSSTVVPKMQSNPMGSEIARGKGIFDQPQDKLIAERLRQAGIPGIRYLDAGSRGTGAGTSNFVVFPGEESATRILERNGIPVQPASVEYSDPFVDTTR